MICPVCRNHLNSSKDNNNILFNGMCEECAANCDYYYKDSGVSEISENEMRENNLSVMDSFLEQDFVDPYPEKEIKNVRRKRKSKKTSPRKLLEKDL